MKKRLPGYLLAVCMVASMLPAAVVAEEPADEVQPVCVCESACTAQAMNEECPVCSAEGAVEQDCAGCAVGPCDSDGRGVAGEDGHTPPADDDKPAIVDAESLADVAGDAAHGNVALGDADAGVGDTSVPAAALPANVAAVQELIDALPDARDVTEEARADLEAQLGAIDEAKAALFDDELAMLDFARYEAAAAALGEDHTPEPLKNSLQKELNDGGTVVLGDNEAISETLVVPEGVAVTLDLNGHSITMTGAGSVIKVDGGSLTLQDSVGTGTITGGTGAYLEWLASTVGGGVWVAGGSFVMNGGTITGCSARIGGGVCVADANRNHAGGGTFVMDGGAIVDCKAVSHGAGGGVVNYSGQFTLKNGTIIGCSSDWLGAAVYSCSLDGFSMYNGSITGCQVSERSSAVDVDAGFLLCTAARLTPIAPRWEVRLYTFLI